ncbi:DJ-1/PfpI family protein [Mesomycoplasma molare]|uniref:DJ-1/PfpI family protein n=1 Tax=Mesomycoplasma molare TaxID=171288 RepID=A0ABY5TTY8_9BACT|nr:DJ-1/PfpI family protein [Mesomycoplasma molare]UWD34127.1 DJ-1/PfpI family protein [Mesomycoplasma molare]
MEEHKNLLVLVMDNFQDYELTTVATTLERAKTFSSITFYNPNEIKVYKGQHGIVNIQTSNINNLDNFDYIFIPSGKGAKLLRKDKKSLSIVQEFINKKKWVFAICDTPNALYEKGIFNSEIEYTAFPNGSIKGKKYKENKGVVVYQKIVTGKSAFYSLEFALKIIEILQGKNHRDKILQELTG